MFNANQFMSLVYAYLVTQLEFTHKLNASLAVCTSVKNKLKLFFWPNEVKREPVYKAHPFLCIKRVMTLQCRSRKFKYAKMFVGKSEKLLKQKAVNRKKQSSLFGMVPNVN